MKTSVYFPMKLTQRLPGFVIAFVAVLAAMVHSGAMAQATSQTLSIPEIRNAIQHSCQVSMDAKLAETPLPATAPSMSTWLEGLGLSSEYCNCAADTFASSITPEQLRSATQKDLEVYGRRAGVACLMPKMKSTFPAFCYGIVADVAAVVQSTQPLEPIASEVCGCMQPAIDALTEDTMVPFFSNLTADMARIKQSGQLPPADSKSLVSVAQRCGFLDLKRRLLGQ